MFSNGHPLVFLLSDYYIIWLSNILTMDVMKVIPETLRVHWIRYLRFYYHWVDISTGRLLVPEGISYFGTDMDY